MVGIFWKIVVADLNFAVVYAAHVALLHVQYSWRWRRPWRMTPARRPTQHC